MRRGCPARNSSPPPPGALSRKALDGAFDDAWTLQVEGKSRRERLVPMPVRLMQALADSLRRGKGLARCRPHQWIRHSPAILKRADH